MARIRSIKPEFWESEEVALMTRDARLLYIATWNLADDEGLLRWTAPYLKANAFMYDDDVTVDVVGTLMDEIVAAGFVLPYRAGATKAELGWIPSFHRHQKPNRPQPSKLQAPNWRDGRVRTAYLVRDGGCCGICGEEILPVRGGFDDDDAVRPSRGLSIDHIEPRSAGGSDYPSNLRAVHKECNSRKGSRDDSLNDSLNDADASGDACAAALIAGGEGRGVGEGDVRAAASQPAHAYESDFDAWYSGYPRKIDRKQALSVYRARRREGIEPGRLTQARDHYAAAMVGSAAEFVKYPATFLAKDGPWSEWEHGPPDGAKPAAATGAPNPSQAAPQPVRVRAGVRERFMPGAGWISEAVS